MGMIESLRDARHYLDEIQKTMTCADADNMRGTIADLIDHQFDCVAFAFAEYCARLDRERGKP